VLNDGEKEQEGTPRELYRRPETRFVAEFVGESTRFDGVVEEGGKGVRLATDARVSVNGRGEGDEGDEASVYVRPENVELLEGNGRDNVFSGEVVEVTEMGSYAEAVVETEGGGEVVSKVDGFSDVREGKEVVVGFNGSDAIVVADGDG